MKDYPIAVIEALIDKHLRLSPIVVDWQYRILLPEFRRDDWDGVVTMDPLPKTILIFFLRHPEERIQFYKMKEFEEEFYKIYLRFTNTSSEHMDKIKDRIHRMVTKSKTFSEFVNDIKQAFQVQLDDRVAQRYYVRRKKGGYGIELSPDLINCP